MPYAKDKSKRTRAKIEPNAFYNTLACKTECGLGRPQLIAGRAAGVLKTYPKGRHRYYLGADLIEWIKRG